MSEYAEVLRRLDAEIERVTSDPSRISIHIPEAAGKEVTSEVIELVDPTFYSNRKTIHVPGIVYLLSAAHLIKTLQTRYASSGNNFADIALEVIDKGDSPRLAQLSRFKTDEMVTDLKRAHMIIRSVDKPAAVVLAGLDPIRPVGEFIEDGLHTSGEPLKALEFPFVVEAQSASFQFGCDGGVAITDGRTEKTMIIETRRFSAQATGMENSIVQVRKGIQIPYADDLVAYLGIIMFAAGLIMIIASRFRLAEVGIIPLIAGIVLLAFRYSPLGADYFSNRITDVRGDAPLKINFYGELK